MRYFGFLLFLPLVFLLWFSIPAAAEPACPNGVCESPILGGNENSCTCPQDCGSCAPGPFEVCKRYFCDSNNICRSTLVSQNTTGNSCCQNQFCEPPENYGTCPQDCGPEELNIEIFSPSSSESFARGEKVLLTVKVSSSGRELVGADVTASGFFGGINLYNDGKHGDGTSYDNVYGNFFVVPASAPEGKRSFTVTGEFHGVIESKESFALVLPELTHSLEAPNLVFLGENISLQGTVLAGSEPAVFSFDFNLVNPRGTIVEKKQLSTNASGFFAYSFHTSLIDLAGEWVLNGYGLDGNKNRFGFSKIVLVEDPSRERFLAVEFSSDKETAPKGETVTFVATVTDFGVPVNDATVELIDPLNKHYSFSFVSDGKYSASYRVPFEAPVGGQRFRIHALRSTGITVEGFEEFSLLVEGKPFFMELLLPIEKRFSIGDTVRFRVRAQYEANQPVLDANAFVIIQEQRVLLNPEGGGFYSGEYVLREQDTGSVGFEAVIVDRFENKSSVVGEVEVFGVGLMYHVQRYGMLFLLIAIAVSLALFALYRVFIRRMQIERLEKRKNELVEMEKTIQARYFEDAAIEKNEFEQFMDSYESEIKEIDKKLAKLGKNPLPENQNPPQPKIGGFV